jgi:hypothetical protein
MRARLANPPAARPRKAPNVAGFVALVVTWGAVTIAPPYLAPLVCSVYAGVAAGVFAVLLRVVGAQGRTRAPAGD